MKGIALLRLEDGPSIIELAEPEITAPDEVLVRVQTSSVNPIDRLAAAGALPPFMTYRFPMTLGRDIAGVVEAVGNGVTRFSAGDQVLGFVGLPMTLELHEGSWAELVTVPEGSLTVRPPGLALAQAGALALAGTAALACVGAANVAPGDLVLVVGGTGGVGHLAVQLLADRGARVVATGRNAEDFLRSLGAAETLDHSEPLGPQVGKVCPEGLDALIDLGSPTVDDHAEIAALLRDPGRAVSANDLAGPAGANIAAFPDPSVLAELAELASSERLIVHVQGVQSLTETVDRLTAPRSDSARGKVGVSLQL